MKKQIIAVLAAAVVLSGTAGIISACTKPHEHTFSDEWATSATEHWHAATCEHKDEVKDRGAHNFNGNNCTVCDYEKQTASAELIEDADCSVTTLYYGDTRIQLLSDSLLRLEDKTNKGFEDRDSYTVYNREFQTDKVEYKSNKTEESFEVSTENYTLVIPFGSKAAGMYITDDEGEKIFNYLGKTGSNVYLPSPSDELSSWYFTDSPRVIPSDCGYTPSDKNLPVNGWEFEENAMDIYVFLPHGDYKTFSTDFVSLTGQSEMLSLKQFGFWESRYYAHTAQSALETIKTYRDKGFSIDVFTVDTDWRVGGGVGYEINTELFPDMKQFLKDAHDLGVNIFFNDHPEPVPGTNNLLDKEEVEYRNEKIVMFLAMGMDYWYYDRNWGVALNQIHPDISKYATGMYAYQWMTEKYYESIADKGEYARRALLQANVDGCYNGSYVYASDLSAHRYSIQWTGDTESGDDWLQQEIEGAIFAGAELGLPYVSADLGGHKNQKSSNSYMRWMQYGALSPVMRTQCTNTDDGRMPWVYGATAEEVVHTYQDMRYRLLPLFYALAHENYETGLPIMRRLDIKYPKYTEAKNNDEYLLGDYILVAPIAESSGKDTREVFFPEGSWIDVWTGKRYSGPNTYKVTHDIKTSPIFVREGALIALADNTITDKESGAIRNVYNTGEMDWSKLALDVYPSANYFAKTTVYEDDRESVAYKHGQFRTTDVSMNCTGNMLKISIGKSNGTFKDAKTSRTWNVRLHKNTDWGEIKSVRVNGQSVTAQTLAKLAYNTKGRPFAFSGGALDGDIQTFTINTKISEAYEIEIEYASVKDSAVYEDYDNTAVNFKVKVSECTESSVNLTELGTTDWVSYGQGLGTSILYKKNGPRAFSKPENLLTLLNTLCTDHMAMPLTVGLNKIYTDGNGSKPSSGAGVRGGSQSAVGYGFTVKTSGGSEKIVLYIGGTECIAKLSVRDRAGKVKTVYMGGKSEKSYMQKVEIDVESGEASTLYFTYAPVTSAVESERINRSRVYLYCGYIAAKEN